MDNKKLTEDQIRTSAQDAGIEYAALRAVMQVECKGNGFLPDGSPVILFERHVFYGRLKVHGLDLTLQRACKERQDLCASKPTVSGGYGPDSVQHIRLQAACTYDRTSALESASWGLGQVMGYQWADLHYPSLQAFINAMFKDEAGQLDAMLRYIKVKHLVDELNRHDWAGFARAYNGAGYDDAPGRLNDYDTKLAQAYLKLAKG